jgi:RNA polymerase sigma factor (sigma-70 family)
MNKLIWQQIIDGNIQIYEQFYHEFFRRFYNYGKKFSSDALLIEDCIQEFFLDTWNRKEKLLEVDSFNSYFYSSFRYILFRKLRERDRILQKENWSDPEFSASQIFLEDAISDTLHQKLQTSLLSLTTRQREAIFLRYYEGLSYDEVSSILGISVKGTYKIIARSLSSLKSKLSFAGVGILIFLKGIL